MTDPLSVMPFERQGSAKRAALAILIIASLATLGLLLVALIRPDRAPAALRWWLLAVGASVLIAAIQLAANVFPIHGRTAFDVSQERWETVPQPPERLRQIERFVSSAQLDRVEFRGRLRLVLLAIAVQRLSAYRGVDADESPDAARAELGERAWTLLTTPATAPDREGPGIETGELRALVTALEKLNDGGDAHD